MPFFQQLLQLVLSLFYFSDILCIRFREFSYYRWWLSLLKILPFFLLFLFHSLRFRPRCWLHMGSVPSSSSSVEYDLSEFSQGSLLDNIFITYIYNLRLVALNVNTKMSLLLISKIFLNKTISIISTLEWHQGIMS